MKPPPALANALLTRLVPVDDPIAGDIHEEWSSGQSAAWFWRQTIAAVGYAAWRESRRAPGRTAAAILTGWSVLFVVFRLGDLIAPAIAGAIWNWDNRTGYANDWWWPFWIAAAVVSYGGYGLSAWVVARLYRGHAAVLISYVALNFLLLLAAGIVLNVLTRLGPVPLPHTLFYATSLTLPYHGYSGLVLAPMTMLLCGTAAVPRTSPLAPRASEPRSQ
jgi:hypothetical protein